MKVQRESRLDGQIYEMELPVTQEQLDFYETGLELAQNVFPNLTAGQREFIISGITPGKWNETFGGLEE